MASINKLFEILENDITPILTIDDINEQLSKHNNSLNILYTNIRSINKHLNDLEHLYTSLKEKCHIIITSEAWLGNDFNSEHILFCKGFNINTTKNNVCKSDGIVMLINNHIIHNTTELIIQDTNCLFTLIDYNSHKYGIL
jgi:hypothetical protein